MAIFTGTSGDNNFTGTPTGDTFNLGQGGHDMASGLAGPDVFNLGAAFDALDTIDGGSEADALILDGDYTAGVIFTATTLTGVEEFSLALGHGYSFTLHDATVSAGKNLAIFGELLGASDSLIVHGEAEMDGTLLLGGGAGADQLYGGANGDNLDLSTGGDDIAFGLGGDDIFSLGGALTAADRLDGGSGTDRLVLAGDYSAGVTLDGAMITNFEIFQVNGGQNYKIKLNDAIVLAGHSVAIVAGSLGAADSLFIDGSAESDGSLQINGGAGIDWLIGGADNDQFQTVGGNDIIEGGGGDDIVDGGNGIDTASYATASGGVTVDLTFSNSYQTVGGGHGADYLTSIENVTGSAFGDMLTGDGGDNALTGGGGNDMLDGGGGNDTAVFAAVRTAYRVVLLGNGDVLVTDLRSGAPNGADTIRNIENFRFSDGDVTLAALLNTTPAITSNGGGNSAAISVAENSTAVTTAVAGDANSDPLTYAIVGGADAARFQINAASGVLSFIAAPDFESPTDLDHDNSYVVTVRASDGTLFDDQTIAVSVTDLVETITGDNGDNTLTSTAESETIQGLGGDDTVVFSQSLDKYAVTDFGNRIVVSGPDGTDTLTGIEHLRFTDGTLTPEDGSRAVRYGVLSQP